MLDFFRQKKQAASTVDRELFIESARFVVIDTELTGLNERRDSIISIGGVRMTGGRIEIGQIFHRLIKPGSSFKSESVLVHGITPSDVVAEPDIKTVLAEFLEYCGPDCLVGHCISIDLSFLNREMKCLFGGLLENPAIDVYRVYEWLRKKYGAHSCFSLTPAQPASLYDVAKCFEIPVRGAHDALVDSFITAQLFQRFVPLLTEAGITTLGDLLEIGDPAEGGERPKISGEISNF